MHRVAREAQDPAQFADEIVNIVEPSEGPSLLDPSWKDNARSGYLVSYAGGGSGFPETFSLMAHPMFQGQTGINTYCIDQRPSIMALGSCIDLSQKPAKSCPHARGRT